MANAKYEFFKSHKNIKEVASSVWYNLNNKYFNIWISKFRIKELTDEQNNYLFKRYYDKGTIACWNIKHTEDLGLADYTEKDYDMYDTPVQVLLINKRGVSENLIPKKEMVVNKDVVLGYAQHNHKSVKSTIDYYISRIAEVELLINNNLNLHKMPYMLTVDDDTAKKRLVDIVDKILNNEQVVYASSSDLNSLQAIALNVPFIIDKLKDYERTVEMELLTQLGIDNNGSKSLTMTNVSVDAVNANDNLIAHWHNVYKEELKEFIERVKKTLGKQLTLIDFNDELDREFTESVHTNYQPNKLEEGEQNDKNE